MITKSALVTGISGQDGSYLAELLIDKGYDVYGLVRRLSTPNTTNIKHILSDITLIDGDLTDCPSLDNAVRISDPDEVYNLAAQSFVGTSWIQPLMTADVTGLGTLRVLESVRKFNTDIRFYNAASSEMFGDVLEMPQTEITPFNPRSPYGISKVFGFQITKNYRESYDIHASSGILFNHESVPSYSPIIIETNNLIDIVQIGDMFMTSEKHRYEGLKDKYKNTNVWNGEKFVKISKGTCYRDVKKPMLNVQTVSSCVELTRDHVTFLDDNTEIESKNLNTADILYETSLPINFNNMYMNEELAKFIGFVVGDGYINRTSGNIRITGTDLELLKSYAKIIHNLFVCSENIYHNTTETPFGSPEMYSITFSGINKIGEWMRNEIYTHSGKKKVPQFILNSDVEIKKAFFDGYYAADGRKAGYEQYEYKGWTTNSAVLNLGLVYLINEVSGQISKTKLSVKNDRKYYYTQLRSPDSNTNIHGDHRKKNLNEIISIYDTINDDGWFYDLQTESQDFATGANLVRIHNSPRRGIEFVTRKITDAAAKISLGYQDKLYLGNLDAKRDWGFAGDYVQAMWLMLQQDIPDDYIIATGRAQSVREFCNIAFKHVGLDYNDYVEVDPKFFRPAEVDILLGDYSKARQVLGWEPETTFKKLVVDMVDNDLEIQERL